MDLALIALAGSLIAASPDSTLRGPRIAEPRIPVVAMPQDPMFEYSAAYYQRVTIHRWGSYAMLPLFVAQLYVGNQLYSSGAGGEDGNKDLHVVLGAGIGVLFASNTVLGAWNLWEGRKDPDDRKRKVAHAILMMAADAGFVATALLGDGVEDTGAGRSTHRAVAIGSMVVATTGWLLMTDLFKRP